MFKNKFKFDIYEENYKNGKCAVVGTCYDMCPTEEITLRQKEKMVHVLERTKSGPKLVKNYCRSAADSNMAVPRLLRPYPVLLDTVQYLLMEVSNRLDVKIVTMYDFLNDRLRAVRQDMTIQRLPPEECIILLEPMIRFYVYYGYRLCELSINEYDPVLNKKYLLECIKWFLSCCDTLEQSKNKDSSIGHLIEGLTALDLNKSKEKEMFCDRVLVECLYILCNLDDVHPLYRYLSLPIMLKRKPALFIAYNIALANIAGNFIRVWKLSRRLCPLTFSALCLYQPTLQRKALQVMSHAYNSKQLTVPVSVIQQWLAFNTSEEVRCVCAHYGLNATDVISFNKTNFKTDVEKPNPRKCYQAKILRMSLEEVVSYSV